MLVVGDIVKDIEQVTGKCPLDYLFSVLTRATETLARKNAAGSVTWDSMMVYVDLPVQQDYYVFLPPQIEKPIKVNIHGNPSFSHSQLYEFTLNGPGSSDVEAGWQWQDRGTWPIQRRFPRSAQQLTAQSDSSSDIGLSLHIRVRLRDRSETYIDLPITPLGTALEPSAEFVIEVLEVVKPVTVGSIKLKGGVYVLAYYYPAVTFPEFHQIKLSQRAVSVRILARKRTSKITSLLDVIPLNSVQALKLQCQAIKYEDEVHFDLAQAAEGLAVQYLNEEQVARNLYLQASQQSEVATSLNLTLGQRDSLIVADIYDEACKAFGFIGREKVFDHITQTLDILYNKTNWDGLIGYVDIRSDGDFYATLPRYVDQIIAMNINGNRGTFRNQWFEFNLCSLGEFVDQEQDPRKWVPWDSLVTTEKAGSSLARITPYGVWGAGGVMRNNRPPYGWEEIGQVPIAFRLKGPAQLFAVPELAQDSNTPVIVYGYDERGEPVLNSSGSWGVRIPCLKNSVKKSKQVFSSIERVRKEPTYGFINLWAYNPYWGTYVPPGAFPPGSAVGVSPQKEVGPVSVTFARGTFMQEGYVPWSAHPGEEFQFLALYWPDDTEPMFRQIRIGTICKRLRIRYRKNWLKISSLTDPIHIKSRIAVRLAMQGAAQMVLAGGGTQFASAFQPTAGIQIATDQLNLAVDLLNDEWRVMHPNEGVQLQWDRRIYGNSFAQIM